MKHLGLPRHLPRLEMVSWRETVSVKIHRNRKDGTVKWVTERDYEQPKWQCFSPTNKGWWDPTPSEDEDNEDEDKC